MQNYSSNVADPAGNAVAFAMISIFNLDGTPATLFSNSTGTAPLPNPFPADAFGRFNLFAANGTYKGTAAGNGILGVSFQFQLYDPNDAPPATLATLAASGGAATVGTADGSTVQAKLNSQAASIASNTSNIAANTDAVNALHLADYTALRAYAGAQNSVYVTGYLASAAPSGIAGLFTRDDTDTTTADNGGTVIVASNGKRWKRKFDGAANVLWFGAKGDGATDDTAAIQAAINACTETYFPALQFNVSSLTIASNKKMRTASKATTLQQIAGQAVGTRMLNVTGSDVEIGSMTVAGNIATDADEQNHSVFVNANATNGNLRNIVIGDLDGFNVRGDVVYLGAASGYSLSSVKVGAVYGDNILRNVVTVCGGDGIALGAITGNRVGLMMLDVEPDASNAQVRGLTVTYVKGGRMGLLATTAGAPISGAEIGAIDLDPSYQPMCSPSYTPGATVNDGLGVRNVASAKIGYVRANGFNRCAIFCTYNSGELGASLDIAQLEMTNCSQTDTTYNAFVNMNNAGHLRIGSLKTTVSTSGKYAFINVTSGRVARCDVTLGTGAQMLRACSNMVVENGAVGGGAGYMLTSCQNVAVKDVQFNGEVLASYSTKLSFENVSATCSTYAFNSGYDLHAVINSTIAGSYYAGGTTGRDYSSPLRFGVIQFWADVKGVLRIKGSAPSSDMDGNPMGQKVTVPAAVTTAGAPGQWAADTSNFYVYTGDGTTHSWRRVAVASF